MYPVTALKCIAQCAHRPCFILRVLLLQTASKSQPGTGSRSRAGAYVPPHLRKKRASAMAGTGPGPGGSAALSAGSSPTNNPPHADEEAPSKSISPFANKPRKHHSLRSPLNKSPTGPARKSPPCGGGMRAHRSPPPMQVAMRVSISVTQVSVGGAPPSEFQLPPSAVSRQQNGVQHKEDNGFKVPIVTRQMQAQRSKTRPRADAAYVNVKTNSASGDGEKNTHNGHLSVNNGGSSRFGGGGNSNGSSRFGGGGNSKGSSRFGSPGRFSGGGNAPSRFGGNSRNNSPRLSPTDPSNRPTEGERSGSNRFSSNQNPPAKKSLNLTDADVAADSDPKSSATARPSSRDEGTMSAAMAAAAANTNSQAQAAV